MASFVLLVSGECAKIPIIHLIMLCAIYVTGALGTEFGSVAEREVPCYIPRSFFTSSGPASSSSSKYTAFIEDLDSFCYR